MKKPEYLVLGVLWVLMLLGLVAAVVWVHWHGGDSGAGWLAPGAVRR
jgi:hypothetical protein